MASLLLIFNSLSPSLPTTPVRASFRPPHVSLYPGVHFSRKARGLTTGVVTRAGPTTSNYVFAFVLPLSLLAITIFASIKVADKLDDEFLEELILQEAMKEGDEEEEEEDDDDDEDDVETYLEEKAQELSIPRTRNRPKREA
ncbi:hypothetical protein Ddye_031741 [Dipteronia dyeriana]|uniref:High chlorophyll fluorescence 153 n=1 Tax=Dipteronia dyeriana TaxID=168575 RepID=A0AAD9TJX7_9ROSI|nr:hypothetical protein Ddye_031741 [Dipteronia dyeriana]